MKGIDTRIGFDTQEEREKWRRYAKLKTGLDLPSLCKLALVQYKTRNPLSATQEAGVRLGRGRPPKKNQTVGLDLSGGKESVDS